MRLSLFAAFLLMGFSFSVTQTLLVREMLVSFSGNELSIGVMLGSWLLLEAVGSGLLARLASHPRAPRRSQTSNATLLYARLQILFALLVLPILALARGVHQLVGAVPGQGLGLLPIAAASFLMLIPIGLVDGAMFAIGCQVNDELPREGAGRAGRVYVLEATGGIVGGLVFTYLFLPTLHSVQMVLVVATLNLASAFSLLRLPPSEGPVSETGGTPRRTAALLAILLVACLGLLLTPGADVIQRRLVTWQWRGSDLAFYDNSVYGNVAAVRQGKQVTFFANGVPVITAPVPDVALVEEMTHLPLLFVEQPRRVLVLGGGLGGVIGETLKYPLTQVDYAELDPLLIEAVASLPTPLTAAELSDARLNIEQVDGRLLVRQLATESLAHRGIYDFILVNLPYPTSLQLNRFHTVEFWQFARQLLASKGVVAFPAPGSLTYLSPALRDLHRGLLATLSEVFPHMRPIPGDVTLWLASSSVPLESMDPETLVRRWEARGLPSDLISDFHIRLRLDEGRLTWFQGSLLGGRPASANRDLHPSGLLHGLAYWNELFSPALTPYFDLLQGLSLPRLLLPLLTLACAGIVAMRLQRRRSAVPIPIAIATTGFSGMTANLLLVFAFQVSYGLVYQYIGLLMTGFMAGLSLGGWLMARRVARSETSHRWRQDRRRLLGLEAALLVFWLVLPVVLPLLHRAMGGTASLASVVGPALWLLNGLAGFLVGAQFPLANQMARRQHPERSDPAALLYAVDLQGAFAAALLVSVALLPALGIVQTCLLVAGLKAGSLALLLTMGWLPP